MWCCGSSERVACCACLARNGLARGYACCALAEPGCDQLPCVPTRLLAAPLPTHPRLPSQAIGNEMDVTLVDLDRLLPPATVMVVTVTATTTSGKPLSEEDLK